MMLTFHTSSPNKRLTTVLLPNFWSCQLKYLSIQGINASIWDIAVVSLSRKFLIYSLYPFTSLSLKLSTLLTLFQPCQLPFLNHTCQTYSTLEPLYLLDPVLPNICRADEYLCFLESFLNYSLYKEAHTENCVQIETCLCLFWPS